MSACPHDEGTQKDDQEEKVNAQSREAREKPHEGLKTEASALKRKNSGFHHALLKPHGTAQDEKYRQGEERQEDGPFDPDRLPLVLDQIRKQVQDANPQTIVGLEENTTQNKYFKNPVLLNAL